MFHQIQVQADFAKRKFPTNYTRVVEVKVNNIMKEFTELLSSDEPDVLKLIPDYKRDIGHTKTFGEKIRVLYIYANKEPIKKYLNPATLATINELGTVTESFDAPIDEEGSTLLDTLEDPREEEIVFFLLDDRKWIYACFAREFKGDNNFLNKLQIYFPEETSGNISYAFFDFWKKISQFEHKFDGGIVLNGLYGEFLDSGYSDSPSLRKAFSQRIHKIFDAMFLEWCKYCGTYNVEQYFEDQFKISLFAASGFVDYIEDTMEGNDTNAPNPETIYEALLENQPYNYSKEPGSLFRKYCDLEGMDVHDKNLQGLFDERLGKIRASIMEFTSKNYEGDN
jgi:hypothetical protein